MHQLLSWDHSLLRVINEQGRNPFFDWLMPWLRNAPAWAPLYLFLAVFVGMNFRKTGWWWILFFLCTVLVTDFISSTLIKEHFLRVRPCNNPQLASWLNVMVAYRPQSSSFTSSHAANHFGLAAFFYITLRKRFSEWPFLFFIWAALICYAQVYVGVHYPLDVAAGSVIGLVIGYLSGRIFNKRYGLV